MRAAFRSSVWTLLLTAGLATPAASPDLSSLTLIYDETYVGEFSYPTTPEVDILGLGG